MVNDILNGINAKIEETFGTEYEIHNEELKQDFKEPCFFVMELKCTQELVHCNRYKRTHSFDIHYFPKSPNGVRREINEIADKLLMAMEYISVNGNLIRGTSISTEIQGDVLHFLVNYNMFIFKVLDEVPKMQTLKQSQYLKAGE